jgi:hypothetical protein
VTKVRHDDANVGNQNIERLLTYVIGRWGADRVGAVVHIPLHLEKYLCGSATSAEIACAFQLVLFDRYLAESNLGFLPTRRAIGAGRRVRLVQFEVESLTAPIDHAELEYEQLFWRFLSATGFHLSRDFVSDAPESLKARYRFVWLQQCFASFLVNVRSSGPNALMTHRQADDNRLSRKQPVAAICQPSLMRLHELGVLPIEDAEYLLHAVLELLTSSPRSSFNVGEGSEHGAESAIDAVRGYEITNVIGDVVDAHFLDVRVESLDQSGSLSGSTHAWTPQGECRKLGKERA